VDGEWCSFSVDYQRASILFNDAKILSELYVHIDFYNEDEAKIFYGLISNNLYQIHPCIVDYKKFWLKEERCRVYEFASNIIKEYHEHLNIFAKSIIENFAKNNVECEKLF